MEFAGVVLGAVPLIFYALDNYGRLWGPVRDWRHSQQTIKTIKNGIFIQRRMLITTLQKLDSRFTEDTTMADVEAALKTYHPNQAEEFMSIIWEMDSLINEIVADLFPDVQGPPNWTYAKSERMSWEWRRVKRSFGKRRRRDIFGKLDTWNMDLANCGMEKREIAPDNEAPKVHEVQSRFDEKEAKGTRENVRMLHMAISSGLGCVCSNAHIGNIQLNWHERTRPLSGAFPLAISTQKASPGSGTPNCLCWNIMSASIEQSATESTASAANAVLPLLLPPSTSSTMPILAQQQHNRQEKKGILRIPGFGATRGEIKRSKSQSWGKTTLFEPLPQRIAGNTPVISQSVTPTPTAQLCALLQSRQMDQPLTAWILVPGSMPCKHISIESLDHSVTKSTSTTRRTTISLPRLLKQEIDQTTNRVLGLDWKQQFRVAAALVWAVFHLCDTPWLKGSIKAENINFFVEDNNGTSSLSLQPYLSYTFGPSSPIPGSPTSQSSHRSTSSAKYQSNQIQNLMLYTLAIRLIELGLNKPFAKLRKKYLKLTSSPNTSATVNTLPTNGASAQTTPSITTRTITTDSSADPASMYSTIAPTACDDYKVAQQQIDRLQLNMGNFYAGAVESCLRFGSLQRGPMNTFENASFLKNFFDSVVAPIQATLELRLNL